MSICYKNIVYNTKCNFNDLSLSYENKKINLADNTYVNDSRKKTKEAQWEQHRAIVDVGNEIHHMKRSVASLQYIGP